MSKNRKLKQVADRISHKDWGDYSTIVIKPRIEGWKETLLLVWAVAFTFCLAFFIYELSSNGNRDEQLSLFIMVAFLSYFSVRTWRVFAWRKYGMEFLKISEDKLIVKRSIRKYGKAHDYFHENILNLQVLATGDNSFFKVMAESFWTIGSDSIGFEHQEKQVRFGKQLSKEDADNLLRLIKKKMAQHATEI